MIFNGEPNLASRKVILDYVGLPLLAEIPTYPALNNAVIRQEAKKIKIEHFF
jgi:hypothetical protein